MFGQLRAKVSAGLTKVRGLAVAAFDPFILLLPVYPFGLSLSLTLVGARRKVLMVVGANILGDPGAYSGGKGKSKRAEKMARRKEKNGKKSP